MRSALLGTPRSASRIRGFGCRRSVVAHLLLAGDTIYSTHKLSRVNPNRSTGPQHTPTDREQHPRHRHTHTGQEQHPEPPNEHPPHTLNNRNTCISIQHIGSPPSPPAPSPQHHPCATRETALRRVPPVTYSANQAEYSIHVLVVAPRDYVNLCSTPRLTDGSYTGDTSTHTHRKLIREWLGEPKGSSLECI